MRIVLNNATHPDYTDAVRRLRDADTAGRIDLAQVVVQMLTPAGAIYEWDSGTIERVLHPADEMLTAVGMPTFNSVDDRAAHKFWAGIAFDLGWEHDYEPESELEPATYTTWDEAVQAQVIDPIAASGAVTGAVTDAEAEYDIGAIADRVLGGQPGAWRQVVDTAEFWGEVAAHARDLGNGGDL